MPLALFLLEKMKTVFGIKKNQTRVYLEDGRQLPATVVKVLPATVVQVKTMEKDGYSSLQLGLGQGKVRLVNKPLQGHIKKAKKEAFLYLREIRTEKDSELKPGDEVKLIEILTEGDKVNAVGTSKGTGFTGTMKRWNFAGGPKTHGQSDRPRSPGSIGQGTTPGRVFKGKKMSGRAGGERVMIQGLSVVKIDVNEDLIWLQGLIPGKPGGLVEIQKAGRETRFSPVLIKDNLLSIEVQAAQNKAEKKEAAKQGASEDKRSDQPVAKPVDEKSAEEKQA